MTLEYKSTALYNAINNAIVKVEYLLVAVLAIVAQSTLLSFKQVIMPSNCNLEQLSNVEPILLDFMLVLVLRRQLVPLPLLVHQLPSFTSTLEWQSHASLFAFSICLWHALLQGIG